MPLKRANKRFKEFFACQGTFFELLPLEVLDFFSSQTKFHFGAIGVSNINCVHHAERAADKFFGNPLTRPRAVEIFHAIAGKLGHTRNQFSIKGLRLELKKMRTSSFISLSKAKKKYYLTSSQLASLPSKQFKRKNGQNITLFREHQVVHLKYEKSGTEQPRRIRRSNATTSLLSSSVCTSHYSLAPSTPSSTSFPSSSPLPPSSSSSSVPLVSTETDTISSWSSVIGS
jgi:hypothetical protein